MNLRAFQPADFKTLHKIDKDCFPPGISYSPSELKRFISHSKSKTWVAEEVGRIAGFLIVSEEPQKVGHIITIDVAEPYRRAGVGTALMDAAEKWAAGKDLRLIYLETADDNRGAQVFYAARGYAKVEEVPNYYSNGQTAWVMVKWL
jgi:[ribosomal protein S18]-alanine N-acetyltransferase